MFILNHIIFKVAFPFNFYWTLESVTTLLTPRRLSVGVGKIFDSVCLSVYLQHNSKTNDPKVFKLGIGYPTNDMVLG